MKKVEDFIKEYTRNCSNEIIIPTQDGCSYTKGYTSWLTPDQARKVAEIAREETIKEVCELFEDMGIQDIKGCDAVVLINKLKEYLTKENKRIGMNIGGILKINYAKVT